MNTIYGGITIMRRNTEKLPITKPTPAFAPIDAFAIYPLELFKGMTGLDVAAMREARRNGLKVHKVGRRHFVRGEDFHDYLDKLAVQKFQNDLPDPDPGMKDR
jgi:hypothetical protein